MTLRLGAAWKGETGKPLKRYSPYSYIGKTPPEDDGDLLTPAAFELHMTTGEPFIVKLEDVPAHPYSSMDQWVSDFSSKWEGQNPFMWQGRLSRTAMEEFIEFEANNTVTFDNFAEVRSRFPNSYLSIVANEERERKLLRNIFDHPPFIPPKSIDEGMWMYSGNKGAGVTEHIDIIGCVCSWSYMLIGSKKWWLRSPPGANPEEKFVTIQNEGDFIFWCVGYFHQTVVESEESLDIHGYVSLSRNGDTAFSRMLKKYSEAAASDENNGLIDSHFVESIGNVSLSCNKSEHTLDNMFVFWFVVFLAGTMFFIVRSRRPKEKVR